MTTILIADDHPIMLEGLASLLTSAGYTVLARCTNGLQVRELVPRHSPDIVVLDVKMPGCSGLEIAAELKETAQAPKIVLLSSSLDDAEVQRALSLDVDGIVLKEAAPLQLLACLEVVQIGRQWLDSELAKRAIQRGRKLDLASKLTPREMDVVRLVAVGLRNKEVALELGITEGTVKMYLHSAYEKLGIGSRFQLMALARREGLE